MWRSQKMMTILYRSVNDPKSVITSFDDTSKDDSCTPLNLNKMYDDWLANDFKKKQCGKNQKPYLHARNKSICCKSNEKELSAKQQENIKDMMERNYNLLQEEEFAQDITQNFQSRFAIVDCKSEDLKNLPIKVEYCDAKLSEKQEDLIVVNYMNDNFKSKQKNDIVKGTILVYDRNKIEQLFKLHERNNQLIKDRPLKADEEEIISTLNSTLKTSLDKLHVLSDIEFMKKRFPVTSSLELDNKACLQFFNCLQLSANRLAYQEEVEKESQSAIFQYVSTLCYNKVVSMTQNQTSWACTYAPRITKLVGTAFSYIACTLGNIWSHPYLASIVVSIVRSLKTFLCVLIKAKEYKENYWKIVYTMGMSLLERSLGHLPQALIIAKVFFQSFYCMMTSAIDFASADFFGATQKIITNCFKTNLKVVGQGLMMVTDMTSSILGYVSEETKSYFTGLSSLFADGGIVQQVALATGLRVQENFDITAAFNSWNKQNSTQFDNYNKVFALHALLNIDKNVIIPLVNTIAPGGLLVTESVVDAIMDVFSKLSQTSKQAGFKHMGVFLQLIAESKNNLIKYADEVKKLGLKSYEIYLLIIQSCEMIKEMSNYLCCGLSKIYPSVAEKLNCNTTCCPDYIEVVIQSMTRDDIQIDNENGRLINTQTSISHAQDMTAFN